MKKIISLVLCIALTVSVVPFFTSCEKKETLNIFNWGQYISDGEDGTLDIVAEFEKCISINNQVLAKLGEVQADAHGAKVAAERAAAGVDELAAEMTAWREWVRELAKHPNAKPGEPKLCATVQGKICEIWQGFKNAPADCELPSGAFRKTKRTFAECLALHGHDEVWHGKRLIDFIPDEGAFERVVHNGAEKARQAKAKAKPPKSQKRKTQARRKK